MRRSQRRPPVATRLSSTLVLLALAAGCQPADFTRMVTVEPPDGWQEQVAAFRADRDDRMRHDPRSPIPAAQRGDFTGLTYWPPDEGYFFAGPVNRYAQPERVPMFTTNGDPRECEKIGWVRFEVAGDEQVLQVYRLLDSGATGTAGLFLPFMDATTGGESYPAGRYVDLQGPEGGPYVLDFNRAYNPECAYGSPEGLFCPKTPEENRLAVRIEAGENGYRRE